MLNLKLKNNATKALIREIEGGLPPDDTPPGGEMPLKEEPSPSSVEPDKGGGEGGEWDIKEIAKRQEGEGDLEMEQRIKAMIDTYLPLLKLDEKQNRHILGHKGYIEGRSYYEQELDAEKIKELIRDGDINLKKGKPWNEKIIIEHPDFEGVVLSHKKTSIDKPIRTRRSKVHFSNNSFHIVPYVGKKGRK